jgi:hypothetical protein
MDPLAHPSILGCVARLQRDLLALLLTRPGRALQGEPSSNTAVRLRSIKALAHSPGEGALLDSLLVGLVHSGVAWEVRPGWYTWTGGP